MNKISKPFYVPLLGPHHLQHAVNGVHVLSNSKTKQIRIFVVLLQLIHSIDGISREIQHRNLQDGGLKIYLPFYQVKKCIPIRIFFTTPTLTLYDLTYINRVPPSSTTYSIGFSSARMITLQFGGLWVTRVINIITTAATCTVLN